MRIQANDQLATELLDEFMGDIEEDRSEQKPGVTDLIRCLTASYWNAYSGAMKHTEKTKIFFFVGLGLEKALLSGRKREEISGVTEGIYWHVDSRDYGLVELKSTRASLKKHLEGDFPDYWMKQIKSYCKVTEVTEVDLAVVYLIPAEFRVYRLSFSPDELEDNWEWMRERKRIWDKAVEQDKAPASFMYNQDWECKDCQYKIICDQRESLGV